MDRSGRWVMGLIVFVAVLLMTGCASDQKAKANIARAEIEIRRAREANAINYAPLELRLAEEKLQQAKKASDDDKGKEARRLADEAQADARVAEAKSRATRTAGVEQQIREDVTVLRQETAPAPAVR